jgi:hypothetical protein
MTPLYGLRAAGTFLTRAGTGAASGAGMRFSKAVLGGDALVVGLRPKRLSSPSPTLPCATKCTTPPRAKLGVDATTQAAAISIAVKTRFMITTPPSEHAGVVLRIDPSR